MHHENSPSAPLPRPLAYLCLAGSMALVGSYVALSKPMVAVIPVFLLAWLRFGIAFVALLPWLKRPAGEPKLSGKTKRLLFLESFLGNFLFSICMMFGISLTSAVSAGVIMATIPAVIALLSWVVLHERITTRVWLSIGFGMTGMALLSLSKQELPTPINKGLEPGFVDYSWLGNLLVFGAVVCEAAYAVIGKKLTGTLSPKRITALINLWGLALVTPLGAYVAWSFDFGGVQPAIWLLLLFYALAASVWTVWLWMTGLKTVPAGQAGVFTVMLPVATAAVGIVVLGEPLHSYDIWAFACALVGVLLATLPTPGMATRP